MAERGLFVSFEGIDGCGKTSQIRILLGSLRDMGIEPVLAQEPGGTRLGRMIRSILLDAANREIDPTTELLLYFASRAQNLKEVIRPALAAGKVVICDRFTDATVAYQGHGRQLGTETVLRLSEIACDGLQPDLTLWLDLDPETARGRARHRTTDEDRLEALSGDFFSRVRQGYAAIHCAEPGRVRKIDADGPPDAVAQRVLRLVRPALEQHGHLPR